MSDVQVFLLTDRERVFLDYLRLESLDLSEGPATLWLKENGLKIQDSYPLDRVRYLECLEKTLPLYGQVKESFQPPAESPEDFRRRSGEAAKFLKIQDTDFIKYWRRFE